MQPKRIIIMLLVVILTLSTAGITVSAEGGLTLDMAVEVSSSTALSNNLLVLKEGETVTFSITVKGNPGFKNASMNLLYDPEMLSLVSYTDGTLFPENALKDKPFNPDHPGKLHYTVQHQNGKNFTATGVAYTCTFVALKHGTSNVILDMDEKDVISADFPHARYKTVNIAYGADALATAFPVEVHNFSSDAEHINATCSEYGKNVFKCSVCNETVSRLDPSDPPKAHVPTAIPSVPPTCTAPGVTQGQKCGLCGVILEAGMPIPAQCPTASIVEDPAVPPTCVGTGLTAGQHCSICNAVILAQNTVPATGVHTYGEWHVEKAATETEDGVRYRECTVCGERETESIPKISENQQPQTNGDSTLVVVLIVVIAVLVAALVGVTVFFALKSKKRA